jgi:hypothetical protein
VDPPYIAQSNGAWILIRGTGNALRGKGIGGGTSTGWKKIGARPIIGAPTAAGTRQPGPHIIAAVRGAHRAPWTTRYPTPDGGWSAFARPWTLNG